MLVEEPDEIKEEPTEEVPKKKKRKRNVDLESSAGAWIHELNRMSASFTHCINYKNMFRQNYINNPEFGLYSLDHLKDYYSYSRMMLGKENKKRFELDEKFKELDEKMRKFVSFVSKQRSRMFMPKVADKIAERFYEVWSELLELMGEVREISLDTGLCLPTKRKMSAQENLEMMFKS